MFLYFPFTFDLMKVAAVLSDSDAAEDLGHDPATTLHRCSTTMVTAPTRQTLVMTPGLEMKRFAQFHSWLGTITLTQIASCTTAASATATVTATATLMPRTFPNGDRSET